MTPEKQRIAIGEKVLPLPIYNTMQMVIPGPQPGTWIGDIPDYLNDLNAVHEVEKLFASTQYFYELQTVCGMPRGLVIYDIESIKHLIIASAAQRCEALLRTWGLWEDE